MMAETVEIDFTKAPAKQSVDEVVWQVENITFTLSRGKSSHAANEYVTEYGLKMFDNQVVTISATGESTISLVTFEDSPMEPTSTAPSFTELQNCSSKKDWGYSVLTPTSDKCTMLGGKLTNGYSGYSHVIRANVETNNGPVSSVDSEAYRKLYLDLLNYRPKVEVHHLTAFYLWLYVERECDWQDDKFESQQACDELYAWLLAKFNVIRDMAGDAPCEGSQYTQQNFQTADLDNLLREADKYYDEIVLPHSTQAQILSGALNKARKAIYEVATQADIDAIFNQLSADLKDVKAACGDLDDPDDKPSDDPSEDPEVEGTPMDPVTPDLTQYTHKVLVESYPRGNGVLNFVILRDEAGRVVQKMSMTTRYGGLETVLTDSIRTYTYVGNKQIEDLSLPSYDENDQLHLTPMSRRVTSYYKLENGRKEILDMMWLEGDDYVTSQRTITEFDDQDRKVYYKEMGIFRGEEDVRAEISYTYTENGVFIKGSSDYNGLMDWYEEYDDNGNLITHIDYRDDNTLTKYFFDARNHNLGYGVYKNYNPEDGTCSSMNEYARYKVDEYYEDGGAKTAHSGGGYTKEFSRSGNVELETHTKGYDTYYFQRTYNDRGELVKKERVSSSKSVIMSYDYTFGNVKASKVLGAFTTIDEDYRFGNVDGGTKWNYEYPIAKSHYFWSEYNDNETSYYAILPISLLPAHNTENGISIPIGNTGDEVVMSADGEIFLLDKGGKKRYSVSVAGITVSSEGGKIIVSGWNPIGSEASASAMRKANAGEPNEINTNDFDIYIPENVISVNGKPLTEIFAPIAVSDESTAIINLKSDSKAASADGRQFNLQGMQINAPANGHILIINGKKVLVK